jgi:hypothetical protein
MGATFLECEELLGAERFVVDLRCGFDQILQMGPKEEVSQVDEFAVVLVFYVDNTPPVLAATDLFAVHNDGLLGSYHGKRDEALSTC